MRSRIGNRITRARSLHLGLSRSKWFGIEMMVFHSRMSSPADADQKPSLPNENPARRQVLGLLIFVIVFVFCVSLGIGFGLASGYILIWDAHYGTGLEPAGGIPDAIGAWNTLTPLGAILGIFLGSVLGYQFAIRFWRNPSTQS